MAQIKTGFKVKVVGEYYARSVAVSKEKVIKNYEFEAIIPSLQSALSTVKNKLLTPMLSKLHEDYIMYRTYHITEIIPLDEKSKQQMKKVEIAYMDRESLVEYIRENNLPVDSRLYPDLFKLRIAVQDAKIDPDAYLKKLALRKDDLELDLTISELNPGLHEKKEEAPSVSMANKTTKEAILPETPQPVKRDLSPSSLEKKTNERVAGLRKDMIDTGEHGEAPEQEGLNDI